MGLTPQHQRRCTSRLRRRPLAVAAGADALAPAAAGCGGGFAGGAVANSGGYSNSTNDSLINQTLTSNNMQAMYYSWQDFLSAQLPMIWQPQADCQLNEIASKLKGVYPLSPTLSINPENWYFVK
jgi:hypothetical protein